MIHQKFKGIFSKISIKHADGTFTNIDGFNNLITNAGLDFIGAGAASTATDFCRASTNADAPLITDTSLVNTVGSSSDQGVSTLTNSGGSPEWFYQMERVYTFAIGAVVGNIAKLGIFSAASGGTMFSVALIKDLNGEPTTISLTASDQLIVTWQLRKYINITPVTGNINIEFDAVMTSVAYEIKPANLGNASTFYYFSANQSAGSINNSRFIFESQTLGGVTGGPGGASIVLGGNLSAYSNGNFYRDFTVLAPPNSGNFATGIGSLCYAGFGGVASVMGYQISFNPKLPKTSDKTLSLPFRVSWGRA